MKQTRRGFISQISSLTAGGIIITSPLTSLAQAKSRTVGEIMDLFISKVPGAPFPNTVDTLKSGSREHTVTGIVTTMFATIPVINQSIKLGANFIIAHEPTFYSHLDKTDWLADNEVFNYKMTLLNKHQVSVWRNHDYIHSHKPDGVFSGLLDTLGWKSYSSTSEPWNISLPSTTLAQLIADLKQKLNISTLRYIGEDNHPCSKVLLMPGAAGGERQIRAIAQNNPDVAIVGELQEWETAEFVRDARASGKKLALIVLGHTDSEDGGSTYMRDWLNQHVPEVKVTHVHSGNPFTFK